MNFERPGNDPFCILTDGQQTWQNFADDVAAMRPAIAPYAQICNLFSGRYDFMVGLTAAMLNGQRTVLPPSRAANALHEATRDAPTLALGGEDLPLPAHTVCLKYRPAPECTASVSDLQSKLYASNATIDVFTSGSTGKPQVHAKTWERLSNGAALTDALVATSGIRDNHALICTTPHQHMYGLEAAIFACVAHRHCLIDAPAFYPADLEHAINLAVGHGHRDIVLVTSPVHMRFLADTIMASSAIRCIISATAPLPVALAERIESATGTPVFEIYGSTETGSIAWRRTTSGDVWSKRYDVTFDTSAVPVIADAPHFGGAKALGDFIELTGPNRFKLQGRLGDMVSVAGKRQALGALNAILPDAPGIKDGVFLLHKEDRADDVLYAVVQRDPAICPDDESCRRSLRKHLVQHVDPVFAPRRVAFVDQIPRNDTGKITAETLKRFVALFEL